MLQHDPVDGCGRVRKLVQLLRVHVQPLNSNNKFGTKLSTHYLESSLFYPVLSIRTSLVSPWVQKRPYQTKVKIKNYSTFLKGVTISFILQSNLNQYNNIKCSSEKKLLNWWVTSVEEALYNCYSTALASIRVRGREGDRNEKKGERGEVWSKAQYISGSGNALNSKSAIISYYIHVISDQHLYNVELQVFYGEQEEEDSNPGALCPLDPSLETIDRVPRSHG